MLSFRVLEVTLALGLLLSSCFSVGNAQECSPLQLSHGTVCKCNAAYCDTIPSPPSVTNDVVITYTTSQAGERLHLETINVPSTVTPPSDAITIELDGSTKQKLVGFGGAFTDSTAHVLSTLPQAAQDKFVSSYFSRNGGAKYSVGRVPVGSADFSRVSYSLVQTANDLSLSDFNIQDDNLVPGQDAKLDLILRALEEIENTLGNDESSPESLLQIFASIWSVPVWMKTCTSPPAPGGTNSCGSGFIPWILGRPKTPTYLFGGLKSDSSTRAAYAQYWLKFLKAYRQHGVELWGVSAQNEPAGNPTGNKWENTNYEPEDLRHFVENFLAPAIKAEFPDMKIMVGDDQYSELAANAAEAGSSDVIDGVGYHWYYSMAGSLIGTGKLIGDVIGGQVEVNNAYKKYNMNNRNGNQFLLMTEACTGYLDNVVQPGSWERGYNYMTSILHELESGAAGWVDWNLALDMDGGPNHADNQVDAPILVNTANGEFYKQPMYYSMAHYSAFIPPGAVRLGVKDTTLGFIGSSYALEVVAFRKSETSTECIMIIANDHLTASLPARGLSDSHTVLLKLPTGKQVVIEMPEHTFKTILFTCPLFPSSSAKEGPAVTEPVGSTTPSTGGTAILFSGVGAVALAVVIAFGIVLWKYQIKRETSTLAAEELLSSENTPEMFTDGVKDVEVNDNLDQKPSL